MNSKLLISYHPFKTHVIQFYVESTSKPRIQPYTTLKMVTIIMPFLSVRNIEKQIVIDTLACSSRYNSIKTIMNVDSFQFYSTALDQRRIDPLSDSTNNCFVSCAWIVLFIFYPWNSAQQKSAHEYSIQAMIHMKFVGYWSLRWQLLSLFSTNIHRFLQRRLNRYWFIIVNGTILWRYYASHLIFIDISSQRVERYTLFFFSYGCDITPLSDPLIFIRQIISTHPSGKSCESLDAQHLPKSPVYNDANLSWSEKTFPLPRNFKETHLIKCRYGCQMCCPIQV